MIYRFGDCSLDIGRRELRRREILCPVEPQVFDLLHLLIANRQRVVSRDEIFTTVWRGRIVSDSVLGNRIHAARKSIGDDGMQQRLIRTLRRNGFRFVGAAVEENEPSASCKTSDPVITRRLRPSLVLISVVSRPADTKLARFCKGLTDDLAVALACFRSFGVVAHDRICKDIDEAIRTARQFEAAYMIGCQARASGGQVRVLIRLIDLCSGLQTWAHSATHALSADFAEQDAIKKHIAAAIEPEIYAVEVMHQHQEPFETLSAARCVLKALSITKVRSRQNYADAMRLLTRATELEPDYARAHSVAAYYYGLQVLWGWKPRREAISLAIQAAQKAAALSELDPWAHFALGWSLTQNRSPEEGIEEYRRAITINPYFSSAYSCLGLALSYVGRIDEALTVLEDGERMNAPEVFRGLAKSARAGVYTCAEKYDDAIKAARASVRQGPGLVASQRHLVANCALTGEMEEASAALRTFLEIVPNATLDSIAGAMPYVRDSDLNRTLDGFRLMGLR